MEDEKIVYVPVDAQHRHPETSAAYTPEITFASPHHSWQQHSYNPSSLTFGPNLIPPSPAPPKRRIYGLTPTRFWILLAIICFFVIGASVGGSVGGTLAVNKHKSFVPTRDCTGPANGTKYTSLYTSGTSGQVYPSQGLHFTKLCSTDQRSNVNNIAEAWVYTFEDCIELCASINFWSNSSICIGVAYKGDGLERPGNCWTHNATGTISHDSDSTIDAALLI